MLSIINKFAGRQSKGGHAEAAAPLRAVLRWQAGVTLVLAAIAAAWAGLHGATSALLGGFCIVSAGWLYARMVSGRRIRSAGETLRTLIRAEAGKIIVIVLQSWLVLTAYRDIVPAAFIAAFIAAVLVYPLVLLVRE